MFITTTKKEETIRIGDNIKILIVANSGKIVKLGIEAPKEMSIARGETKDNDTKYNK